MKNKGVYKTLFFSYKICFIFIPVPFFFDFGSMNIFFASVEDYSPLLDKPSIPMPIGALALIMALFLGYLLHIISPSKINVTLPPMKLLFFMFYFVCFFGFYAIFIAGLSIPRFIQVILPVIFLMCLSFPSSMKDRKVVLMFFLFGLGIWFLLHFYSIMVTAEEIFEVKDRSEFSSFYGLVIYQSLISYPAVISIAFILVLALLLRQFSASPLFKSKLVTWCCFLLAFILVYLGFSASRKAFVLEFLVIIILISLSIFSYCFLYKRAKIKSMVSSFLFFLFSSSSFLFYFKSDLSNRLVSSIVAGNVDSGRVDILDKALSFFYQNPDVLFWGAGGSGAPNFHNFFLDQIYRVGVFGIFFTYFTTAYLLRRFYRKNNLYKHHYHARLTFIMLIFSSFFLQSMINASISQPYYLVNFIVILTFIVFVVFCGHDFLHKRNIGRRN